MSYDSVDMTTNNFCVFEDTDLKVIKYKNEILFEYNLIDGKVNGIGFCYYPFLKKTAMIGEFKNDQLHGKLLVFDFEGMLIEIMLYKNGKYKEHLYFWNESITSLKHNSVKSSSLNPLRNDDLIVR
jgi:antitoxin component YwqK of YwqJK toxin-antitoxin module